MYTPATIKPKEVNFDDKEDKIDESLIAKMDNYDKKMINYMAKLYYSLNGDKLDLDGVQNAVDALSKFNSKQEFNYLNNLLYPERCKGSKIPSPIPVPSNAFQLHNTVTLSTNSKGNLAFIFNPFFLYNKDSFYEKVLTYNNGQTVRNTYPDFLSTLVVNNHEDLDGHTANAGTWVPVNIGQGIPGVYDQYRLVSASIVVKYIGRLDYVQGVIGGAIVYDRGLTGMGSLKSEMAGGAVYHSMFSLHDNSANHPHNLRNRGAEGYLKYSNFDVAMDSFYHQENVMLEGIRELYFPIDNTFEEYQRVGVYNIYQDEDAVNLTQFEEAADGPFVSGVKPGFSQMVYVLGGVPSSASYKVDIYCNFECLPNPEFLNYMPLSITPTHVDLYEKQQAIAYVQNQPIMNTKETGLVVYQPSIIEKMKKKFQNSLPGIAKMIAGGLTKMVPGLKPGLALAGSMIGMDLE